MRESRPPGSVRGVPSNGHPYRDVRREIGKEQRVEVSNRKRSSKPNWPRVMRSASRGARRALVRPAGRTNLGVKVPRTPGKGKC